MGKRNVEALTEDMKRLADARAAMGEKIANLASLAAHPYAQLVNVDAASEILKRTSEQLRSEVYRVMVLGDFNRGKSTLLNAILGEDLLPMSVTACTAIITLLRYGPKPTATVHFKPQFNRQPETYTIEEFKRKYTISPEEVANYEKEGLRAFPEVEYAVVTHPLDLLKNGVEIVDSPGLNRSEEDNEITLKFLEKVQAVLFLLSPLEPVTMLEQAYLETNVKPLGLTIFYVLNGWDRIQAQALRPEMAQEAEEKVRASFRLHLTGHVNQQGEGIYDRRVFETNALGALRCRLNRASEEEMAKTGVPQFTEELRQFLVRDRGGVELNRARKCAEAVVNKAQEGRGLRLHSFEATTEELDANIEKARPRFDMLRTVKDGYGQYLQRLENDTINEVCDSLQNYMRNLANTFERDFDSFSWPGIMALATNPNKSAQKCGEVLSDYTRLKLAEWGNREVAATVGRTMDRLKVQQMTVEEKVSREMGEILKLFGGDGGVATLKIFDDDNILVGLDGTGGVIQIPRIHMGGLTVAVFLVLIFPILIICAPIALCVGAGAAKKKFREAVVLAYREQLSNVTAEAQGSVREKLHEHFARIQQNNESSLQEKINEQQNNLNRLVADRKSVAFDAGQQRKNITTLMEGDGELPGIIPLTVEITRIYETFMRETA